MPSLAEIVMLGGQQRANSMRRLADIEYTRRQQQSAIWGNLGMNLANLGANTAVGIIQGRQEQKANEAKLAAVQAEKEKIAAATTQDRQQWDMAYASATEKLPTGVYRKNVEKLQTALEGMGASHLLTKDRVEILKEYNAQQEQIAQAKVDQVARAAVFVAKGGYNPAEIENFAREQHASGNMTQQQLDLTLAATGDQQKRLIDAAIQASPKYADLLKPQNVGGNIFTPLTGQMQTPPPPAPTPSPVGSLEDYLLKTYGPNPSPAQILEGREKHGAAGRAPAVNVSLGPSGNLQTLFTADKPDPKTANKVDPRTGLTPNALDQMAMTYATMGTGVTSNSRNPQVMARSSAILNTASAMAAAAGVDLALLRGEFTAHVKTFGKLLDRVVFTNGALEAAKANMELVRQYAGQVGRTEIPRLNEIVQSLKNNFGASDLPNLTALEVAVFGAAREYARATSGGTQSIAQMTEGATKAATALLNTAQTAGSMDAALRVMDQDLTTQTQPYINQLNDLLSTGETANVRKFLNWRMNGLLDKTSAAAPAPGAGGRQGGPPAPGAEPARPAGVPPNARYNGRTWVAGLPGQVWDEQRKVWR